MKSTYIELKEDPLDSNGQAYHLLTNDLYFNPCERYNLPIYVYPGKRTIDDRLYLPHWLLPLLGFFFHDVSLRRNTTQSCVDQAVEYTSYIYHDEVLRAKWSTIIALVYIQSDAVRATSLFGDGMPRHREELLQDLEGIGHGI